MKIRINKEMIFALLAVLPYIEGNFLQKILDIYVTDSAYIKAIIFVMIAVSFVFLILLISSQGRHRIRYYEVLIGLFVTISLIYSLITASSIASSFCVWLWLCVPMIYAVIATIFSRQRDFDLSKVLVQMVRYFSAYVFIVVVYYVLFKHLFLDPSIRMSPRGGGAVIFGYTIALVCALTLHLKKHFIPNEYYIVLIILTVGALGTRSRASIWPIIFCWIANFVLTKFDQKKALASIALIPALAYLATIDYGKLFSSTSYVGWQRLFNVHSLRRAETVSNILKLEAEQPFIKKLVGFGLGNLFPYIGWVINVDNVDNNMVNIDGHSILVQPHNSFLYFLMETGLIGLAIILMVLFMSIWTLAKQREDVFVFQLIFFGTLLLVNCVDSIFFVQPGPAGLYWLLVLLVVERHLQVVESRGRLVYDEPG